MQTTEHTLVVNAPPRALYGLVADVTLWPALFRPSVFVRHLERSTHEERFRLWATVNGEVTSWVSARSLDPAALRVRFAQEVSRPPFASMSGEWLFRERAGGQTEIVLLHHFTPVDDDPATLARITAALDHNSTEELAALGRVAESAHRLEDIVFSFTDTIRLSGTAADAYDFVARADLWPVRLPHVSRVRLAEPAQGVQELEMDTSTADGSTHTTRSIRICEAHEWIAYKQQLTPDIMLGHSGLWTFDEEGPEATITSQHTVVLDPEKVTDPAGTKEFVRQALGRNSTTTMTHAAAHAA